MLRKIKIDNYKMFRDFELDFTDGITLICGPNGSGKSALREVLFVISNFLAIPDVTERVAKSVISSFPYEVFCRWMPQKNGYNDIRIYFEIDGINESGENVYYIYDLTVRYSFSDRKSRVHEESLIVRTIDETKKIVSFINGDLTIFTENGNMLNFYADQNISGLVTASRNNSKIKLFGELITKIIAVYLTPALIAQDFTVGSQTIGSQGEYFTAWNFQKLNRQPHKQIMVFEQCKSFIPGFIAVYYNSIGDSYRCKASVEYNGKSYELALNELSDGQKILFALYSIIINVPDGSILLIDEPENFLAPTELQPWLDAVNDAWEERNIQFILITHNPKTLNWYHKEAIIFSIVDEPPRIEDVKNSNDTDETLFEKLCEMEWLRNDTKS